MQNLNKWVAAICVSVVVILAQVITTQYMVISNLRSELDFARASHRLATDQIADITYQLDRLREERDTTSTQQFIAGIVSTIDRHNDYSAIWHDGYSRGTAVQQYAAELDAKKTAVYTDNKK